MYLYEIFQFYWFYRGNFSLFFGTHSIILSIKVRVFLIYCIYICLEHFLMKKKTFWHSKIDVKSTSKLDDITLMWSLGSKIKRYEDLIDEWLTKLSTLFNLYFKWIIALHVQHNLIEFICICFNGIEVDNTLIKLGKCICFNYK